MMRILFLVSGIGPPAAWGTEYIQNLIFALSKKGVGATIINPIYKHTHPYWPEWIRLQEEKFFVKIIPIQIPDSISRNLMLHLTITPFLVTYQAIKQLSKEDYDLVHEFSSTPIILFRAVIFRLFFKIPTIFTLSVYNNTILGNLLWVKLFNFAKFYLIPSKEIIKNLTSIKINKGKLIYSLPGINSKPFILLKNKLRARVKLNLPKTKFIFSYFGPLTKEKGVEDLLKAASLINKSLHQKILICIFSIWKGSDQHQKFIEEVRQLNLTYLKLFEDYVSISDLLAASNVIILPLKTGFGTTIPPISLIETLISGKPVITTDIIGTREWVNKLNGFLIKPGNPKTLSDAIKRAYSKKFKSNKTNQEIVQNFNLAKSVKLHLSLYRMANKKPI